MTKKFIRTEYEKLTLRGCDLSADPFLQLHRWWQDAIAADVDSADAVSLATVDEDHHPDARIVLLKSFDERGLVFYSNYQSPKSQQLSANPHAALVIFWHKLERQVRIRGRVEKTSREESESYFATRPRGAQVGTWGFAQSQVLKDRQELDDAFQKASDRFASSTVPCPPHWGGFRLIPDYFEFWQGQKNRLHDRFRYRLHALKDWRIERLAP